MIWSSKQFEAEKQKRNFKTINNLLFDAEKYYLTMITVYYLTLIKQLFVDYYYFL